MRANAVIRKMLMLELLEKQFRKQMGTLQQELQAVRKQLQQEGISILDRKEETLEIRVQYHFEQRLYTVSFMRPMIGAEVEGTLRDLIGESIP